MIFYDFLKNELFHYFVFMTVWTMNNIPIQYGNGLSGPLLTFEHLFMTFLYLYLFVLICLSCYTFSQCQSIGNFVFSSLLLFFVSLFFCLVILFPNDSLLAILSFCLYFFYSCVHSSTLQRRGFLMWLWCIVWLSAQYGSLHNLAGCTVWLSAECGLVHVA